MNPEMRKVYPEEIIAQLQILPYSKANLVCFYLSTDGTLLGWHGTQANTSSARFLQLELDEEGWIKNYKIFASGPPNSIIGDVAKDVIDLITGEMVIDYGQSHFTSNTHFTHIPVANNSLPDATLALGARNITLKLDANGLAFWSFSTNTNIL